MCNDLRFAAIICNALQRFAFDWYDLQLCAMICNYLQFSANIKWFSMICNYLRLSAMICNSQRLYVIICDYLRWSAIFCESIQSFAILFNVAVGNWFHVHAICSLDIFTTDHCWDATWDVMTDAANHFANWAHLHVCLCGAFRIIHYQRIWFSKGRCLDWCSGTFFAPTFQLSFPTLSIRTASQTIWEFSMRSAKTSTMPLLGNLHTCQEAVHDWGGHTKWHLTI